MEYKSGDLVKVTKNTNAYHYGTHSRPWKRESLQSGQIGMWIEQAPTRSILLAGEAWYTVLFGENLFYVRAKDIQKVTEETV